MQAKSNQQRQQQPPASPWTEAYHAASQVQQAASMPTPCCDSDDQKPTHDALSDIYNRSL